MTADTEMWLDDILDCSERIQRYTSGMTKEQFVGSELVQDAVMCRIEIMGEAVKNLPPEFTAAHPEIPWRDIARMRDLLIHHYFSIDLELTWTTATSDVPVFEQQIRSIVKDLHP